MDTSTIIVITIIVFILFIISLIFSIYNKTSGEALTRDLEEKLTNRISSLETNNIRGIGDLPIFWTPDKKYYASDSSGSPNQGPTTKTLTKENLYNQYGHLYYQPSPYEYSANLRVGSIWEFMEGMGKYIVVHTIIPWYDTSGGSITQIAYLDGSIYTRGVAGNDKPQWTWGWTPWEKVTTK
jgi:hypothetical protein